MTSVRAASFDLPCRAAHVDFWLEKRHLQALLLDFLQQRFPRVWAAGVAERSDRSMYASEQRGRVAPATSP
jgi:hypothetical protein